MLVAWRKGVADGCVNGRWMGGWVEAKDKCALSVKGRGPSTALGSPHVRARQRRFGGIPEIKPVAPLTVSQ